MASQSNPSSRETVIDTALDSSGPSADGDSRQGILYQSPRLTACAKRLIHAFTGKPLSLGGLAMGKAEKEANRKQWCDALGIPFEALVAPDQVHSDVSKQHQETLDACDAVILTNPGQAALVMVADCVPIMLYDQKAHKAAVIHAGWRGTAQSITAKTAKRLVEAFGCRYEDIIAAIGPSIGVCCYEVSDEVVEALAASIPCDTTGQWHRYSEITRKPSVDLKLVNRLQLETLGVTAIDVLPNCTQCEPDAFFSHRRDETGRQGAIMMLK